MHRVDKEMLQAISEMMEAKLEEKLKQNFSEKLAPIVKDIHDLQAAVLGIDGDLARVEEKMPSS